MKTTHSVWLFQNWASFQRDVEFAFFGHVYSTFEICVSIRFCWRNLFLSALCVVMVALDTNLFVSFARPWGGASPHFWSKGQTYLLLDIMKYLDIKGFLHTSQRRPLKNVAEGLKQVGSICTVLPQTATGHFST